MYSLREVFEQVVIGVYDNSHGARKKYLEGPIKDLPVRYPYCDHRYDGQKHPVYSELTGASRVLEVGCGAGVSTSKIRGIVGRNTSIISLDVNQPNNFNSYGIQADGCDIPLTDNWAEVTLCEFVLVYLKETQIQRLVLEVHRTLVNGGIFCVGPQIKFSEWWVFQKIQDNFELIRKATI